MDETNVTDRDRERSSDTDEQDDAETVAAARRMGWKPQGEFKDKPEKWVDASTFLKNGFGTPAVLADRYNQLDNKFRDQERALTTVTTKLSDAQSTINDLTTMVRASEERAYKRARRELEAERTKAVELGDTAAFTKVDQDLRELDQTAPKPAPAAPAATQPPAGGQAMPPEVQAFFDRNPAYKTDAAFQLEADIIHTGLRTKRPDMSQADNLAEVERRMRQQFPQHYATGGARQTEADNDRRGDSPAVSPSSGGAPRQQARRRSFEAMPRDSKDAYTKYAKMLEGKGKPLTKEEWAEEYWGQFTDDGA